MSRQGRRRRLCHVAGVGTAVAVALGTAGAVGTSQAAAASTERASARSGAVPAVSINPPRRQATQLSSGRSTGDFPIIFSCQEPSATVTCYGPDQIRRAYNIDKLIKAGYTGKGETIVIVDAFQSPTIRRDLAVFNRTFGLPDSQLQIIAPDGLTPFDPNDANQVGWAGEISLDVQWAHAIAPEARIRLVLAKDNNDTNIQRAVKYAVDRKLGDVLSQSFGEAESCYGVNADGSHQPGTTLARQHDIYQAAVRKRITVLASSGDSGSVQPTCDGSGVKIAASTPASDPLVTSVGGTQLFANPRTGTYDHEVVWNEEKTFGFHTSGGGGFSSVYEQPAFQSGAGELGGRGVPDVAYNAAIDGGVLVANSATDPAGSFFLYGGTSAGTPQWAGIVALANQKNQRNVGEINTALYRIAARTPSAFHDITVGSNGDFGVGGYTAGAGWDAASGLGSPVADKLVANLVAAR